MTDKHRYVVYWWAKTNRPKKRGHDYFETDEDMTDDEILRGLELVAESRSRPEWVKWRDRLPNFDKYYPGADVCENFGLTKVVRTEVGLRKH